ncbi:MAG: alkaline phosphatase family protein, partial [Spirochaetales bacterium]|nr:alkaline phosphatase family protein [Spirochaetales bacterium]
AGAKRSEHYMQMIMDACRDAGIYESTDFVVCSDHGQINYSRRMNLNVLFVREGLIELDEKGDIKAWKAWAKSANFCAQIHLSDPSDKALQSKVKCILDDACKKGDMGIGRVMTSEEARKEFGLYGDFSFVLESDESTLFFSDWKEPLFSAPKVMEEGYLRASHGHDPAVGPQPVFIGYGPSFRRGVVLPEGSIIDEAPTYARILGLELPDAEGEAMEALLR